MCKGTDVVLRELVWNQDVASFIPRSRVETRVAIVCQNCRYVRLRQLRSIRFSNQRRSLN